MSQATDEKKIEIRAYNIWQLCELYGIGRKAFKEWIEPFALEIGEMRGKKYTPQQVKIIFDKVGEP